LAKQSLNGAEILAVIVFYTWISKSMSWGTTVNEVVNHLPARINRDVDVVQITGGSHQLSIDLNCHHQKHF